jgi:hypothetical protein
MPEATSFLIERVNANAHVMETAWASDQDRWIELIFCVLYQARPAEAEATRHAIILAVQLGAGAPETLAEMDHESALIWNRSLMVAGWPEEVIAEAMSSLARLGSAIRDHGGLQKLLRKHAEKLRDDLLADLGLGNDRGSGRAAVGHWLQNTCNLPITFQESGLAQFATSSGFTMDQLIEAAESLGINAAVLDDLLHEER